MHTESHPGPGVRAVIFDVSGTTLDFGSRGPVAAFLTLFERHGVPISIDEARRPMGAHKKDHIRKVLADPAIAARWEKVHGQPPDEALVQHLFDEFVPLQTEVLPDYCDVIPGVPELVRELRGRGIRIANTTGFDSTMMQDLVRLAAEGGYSPDLWVTPDVAGGGRPAPWMAFYAARRLNVYPMDRIVKVGDTPVDVAEAHNAGMWAVSVVRHGNEVGLTEAELGALPEAERQERIGIARQRLEACKPHYAIDNTADLLPVIDEISARLSRGERP
jgi:phosphonoacetaldehyde hydrolase